MVDPQFNYTTSATTVTNVTSFVPTMFVQPLIQTYPTEGGEQVTDIAPVSGMSPEEVVKELRVIVKTLFEESVASVPAPLPGSLSNTTAQARLQEVLGGLTKIMEQTQTLEAQFDVISNDLASLVEIAKKRRPSEVRKQVEAMQPTLTMCRNRLGDLRTWVKWVENRPLLQAAAPVAAAAAPKSDGKLKRAYALVQAIPTVKKPPIGKQENTLRAIMAVLKVHEGLDPLCSFGEISPPEMPVVIANEVVKEKVVEVPAAYLMHPFFITSKSRPKGYDGLTIISSTGALTHGAEVDGVGDSQKWNNGLCSVEDAANTFRSFCNRYNLKDASLVDGSGRVLGTRLTPSEPIVWELPHLNGQAKPVVAETLAAAATTS